MKPVQTMIIAVVLVCSTMQSMQQYKLPVVGQLTPAKAIALTAATIASYKIYKYCRNAIHTHQSRTKNNQAGATKNNHAKQQKQVQLSLSNAAYRGDHVAVTAAIKAGADCNQIDSVGDTPLMDAILGESFHPTLKNADFAAVVRLLLEAQANPHNKGKDGRTALEVAKFNGCKQAVEAIEAHEKKLSLFKSLQIIVMNAHKKPMVAESKARNLLQYGADVNHIFSERASLDENEVQARKTLLHDEVQAGHPYSVALLLGLGADVTIKDGKGKTAEEYAHTVPAQGPAIVELFEKHRKQLAEQANKQKEAASASTI